MLKITSEVNGTKSYSGLSTDVASLPVNPQTGAKVSHQGDTALIWNADSAGGLDFYGFDEANNVWRKA